MYSALLTQFFTSPNCQLSGKNKKRLRAIYQNNVVFRQELSHLIDLYMYSFTVRDKSGAPLPSGMSERIIKLSLLFNGCVVFTDGMKWNGQTFPGKYAFMGYPSGKGWNIKGNPLSAFTYSMYNGMVASEIPLYVPGADEAPGIAMGFSGQKADSDPRGCMVWASESRFPFIYTTIYYATALADCMRTLDVTRFWLKRPVIFTSDKELLNSINEAIEKMELNEEWTVQASAIGDVKQTTNLLNPNVNGQNLKDVTGLYEWYLSKYKERLGIDSNSQMDKKGENLQTAEITVNDEYQHDNIDMVIQCLNAQFEENIDFIGVDLEAVARTDKTMTKDTIQEGEADNGSELPTL